MEDVLIQEIHRLRHENQDLKRRLAAKRYRLADTIVDTAYKGIYLVKPKPAVECMATIKEDANEGSKKNRRRFEKNRVDIINVNFYDWDGNVVYKGGAERYVYDLAKLLQSLGYTPRIVQGANKNFSRNYRGIPVYGLKASGDNKRELSKIFGEFCKEAEFIIASPNDLLAEIESIPCLGVNHSIQFDGPSVHTLTALPNDLVNPYKTTLDALQNVKLCVCTDTNFVNWVRTRDYELSKKVRYVPNYYDKNTFRPVKKKTQDRVVFVFPRRIEESRGHKMAIEAFRKVIKIHPNIELRLIGQIQDSVAQKDVDKILADFPENVFYDQFSMEDSYKAFYDSDIMLAPTTFTDGTPLACIEALASGLPVIATTVGGLPNLVIDHFNGLLIPTTVDDLSNAMKELIENPELRKNMGDNSLNMAQSSFEKHLWEERWKNIIQNFIKQVDV